MLPQDDYQLVRLKSGACTVRSRRYAETYHPVIGPVAEAEALYVRQTRLIERLTAHEGEFVVWDVGLGAGANILTVLRSAGHIRCRLRVLSFDQTAEPLAFALQHADELGYLKGFEPALAALIEKRHVQAHWGNLEVNWQWHVGDFPAWLNSEPAASAPKPHLILFDPHSPSKNPEMWTLKLFSRLHDLAAGAGGCVLPTYSRSTMLRVTLLMAGFFVGAGHATGEKEETTIAATDRHWVEDPLGPEWLSRAERSTSAEPLQSAAYRQAPMGTETRERLLRHPQFR